MSILLPLFPHNTTTASALTKFSQDTIIAQLVHVAYMLESSNLTVNDTILKSFNDRMIASGNNTKFKTNNNISLKALDEAFIHPSKRPITPPILYDDYKVDYPPIKYIDPFKQYSYFNGRQL